MLVSLINKKECCMQLVGFVFTARILRCGMACSQILELNKILTTWKLAALLNWNKYMVNYKTFNSFVNFLIFCPILERTTVRLKEDGGTKWMLISTSCLIWCHLVMAWLANQINWPCWEWLSTTWRHSEVCDFYWRRYRGYCLHRVEAPSPSPSPYKIYLRKIDTHYPVVLAIQHLSILQHFSFHCSHM